MRSSREELVERMTGLIAEDGILEVFDGFRISRVSKSSETLHTVYDPCFCFVIQGSKQLLLGDETFRYDPGHYLISTVDLPVSVRVDEASREKPYLGFRMDLDPALVATVVLESGIKIRKGDASVKAMNVSPIDEDLLDAIVRLFRILASPEESKFLAPLTIKEIIYRLCVGGQGARLGHLLTSKGDAHRISEAVKLLRENFDKPLKIEDIARELGMSVSGFHHHFKSVTTMSPIQFQKQLRLQEARRLMLDEELDAANAGFRVGFEDPSYFSREYKKLFGIPPHRDIAKLRSNLGQ